MEQHSHHKLCPMLVKWYSDIDSQFTQSAMAMKCTIPRQSKGAYCTTVPSHSHNSQEKWTKGQGKERRMVALSLVRFKKEEKWKEHKDW